MWQKHKVAWVTRWDTLFHPTKIISWQYWAYGLSTQLCVPQKSPFSLSFGRLFCHRHRYCIGQDMNMRPSKHCKLIFENSTVAAKYSVADLIKHINKCPLLFCCKWRGKKLSYNFIDVLCVLAKGKPFSWFSSSYSVLRIPLLQSMAYICHLADLFFVFDIFSHKIMTTMFIYSNTDEC